MKAQSRTQSAQSRIQSDRQYNVVVRWSDIDNAYLAELSDFPGVSGYGQSREQAIKQVEHALQLALETHAQRNWEPPRPDSSLGASGQFRLRLPKQLHARLSLAATQNGVSLNQFVVSLIADGLARAEQLPKNELAELREWFDTTLQRRLLEATMESQSAIVPQIAPVVQYPPGMIPRRKPFDSPSKWEPFKPAMPFKPGYGISEQRRLMEDPAPVQKKSEY